MINLTLSYSLELLNQKIDPPLMFLYHVNYHKHNRYNKFPSSFSPQQKTQLLGDIILYTWRATRSEFRCGLTIQVPRFLDRSYHAFQCYIMINYTCSEYKCYLLQPTNMQQQGISLVQEYKFSMRQWIEERRGKHIGGPMGY